MQYPAIQSDTEMTALQRDILSTLAYFDIFDHPLLLNEIHRFLPRGGVTEADVKSACFTTPLEDRLFRIGDLYFLAHRSGRIAAERRTKERRARRLWKAAILMSHIVRRFPFVRGVFVSGELSKGVASRNSDIDFFVVTAENRVWICRSLFAVFKKIFLFNRKKFFCYNLITSEHHLEVAERNIYTATEVVTVRPLFNADLFDKFIRANSWTAQFLPNSRNVTQRSRLATPAAFFVERLLTAVVPSEKLDALDRWLLEKWRAIWKRRYHDLSPRDLENRFQCQRNLSTAYAGDFLHKVLDRYRFRLDRYGIARTHQSLV